MSVLSLRGNQIDVDIESELRDYEWSNPKWSHNKLIASSPFRYDKSPSFFVNLEGEYAGVWGDAGAYDTEFQSGGIVKLLAFLRNESYEEAEEYLIDSYGISIGNKAEQITLPKINLKVGKPTRRVISDEVLAIYDLGPCQYLTQRGISESVQQEAGVYFSRQQSAVVIPWRSPTGKLMNVKYRKTKSKVFWYLTGGVPIRELVYGIDQAARTTVLCEAEIDALSWRTAGFAAIAVGGVAFNGTKRDLIIRSPIEELIIATDNDKAGEKLRQEVAKELCGYVRVRQAYIEGNCKDANEALVKGGVDALRESAEKSELCRGLYVNLRTGSRGK